MTESVGFLACIGFERHPNIHQTLINNNEEL
jgi:hypothetical protein